MSNKPKVMIITSVHRWDDTRIFHRQATSLARKFDVELHAPADFNEKELNNVKILGLPKWRKKGDRIKIWLILLKRTFLSKSNLIHLHDPELIPLAMIVKLILRKKIIYDVHEEIVLDIQGKDWIPSYLKFIVVNAFILIEKICVPFFDAVVYTTPIVGKRYVNSAKKAVSIENYSKVDTFLSIRRQYGQRSYEVIYLGRVLNVRGVDRVIRAFQNVVTRISEAKFIIVGDVVPESYENELRNLVKSLQLEAHVDFVGFVPHLETISYLKRADCGIVTFLPKKLNRACLPNKLFEYMACGLPVIASDFDLYKEVIEESECGINVDPENIEMIADAIVDMLSNTDSLKKMGLNGKKAFETRYNWEREEIKLLKLYDDIFNI
jgi:glycosyltransferase involved in cell wall biosynthesis